MNKISDSETLIERILELDARNTADELALNLCAAFLAYHVGTHSLDEAKELVRSNDFLVPEIRKFWTQEALAVVDSHLESLGHLLEKESGQADAQG